ncbi:MAG: RluA family pseudouridine synthase [Pseudomonadales bacterium]|nr:RluA family pseudouridine synthase [Pseudomonadales bacterium]
MSGNAESVVRAGRVPRELAGERVDRAAAVLFDEFSRVMLGRWIEDGSLTCDGRRVRPRDRVRGGEELRLDAWLLPREDWRSAQPVGFTVVYEDPDLLVIDKPAGVVVHPGAGNPDGTLVNGLLAHRPGLARLPRAGIVHRLDKDTSGLLLVAATPEARTRLVGLLAARQITRRYLAVVEGCLAVDRTIDQPVGRDPTVRTRQCVRADGRPARTHVHVRARFRAHTLIEATLDTGRTHQIRVHLAHLGHPLVGDARYGARGRLPPGADPGLIEALQGFRRQALHAWQLAFAHPITGAPLAFEAPLPADLSALVDALARDADASRVEPGRARPRPGARRT